MREITPLLRIFHWLIAIGMVIMLVTVIMRKTWFDKNEVGTLIYDSVSKVLIEEGQPESVAKLNKDEFIKLAKNIRQPMWNWHIYTGYVLIGVYALRIFLLIGGKLEAINPLKQTNLKDKLQAFTYLIFYLLSTISLITGFLIVNGPEAYEHTLEEIHELSLYYLIPYIFLHFSGLIIAERSDRKGIAGKMISG